MNPPRPEQLIFRRNLRLSGYFGAVGVLLAVIPCFWIPIYSSFLILAAIGGAIGFFMIWFGVRRQISLNPVAPILMIVLGLVGRDFLLPHDISPRISFLYPLQFAGVWIFVMAALHIAFRVKLKRDLESDDA